MEWIKKSLKFFGEVYLEVQKVTWPTSRDVVVSSAMVLILAGIFAVYFFLVDSLMVSVLRLVLKGGYGG